jgi:hypothetical protein
MLMKTHSSVNVCVKFVNVNDLKKNTARKAMKGAVHLNSHYLEE